MGGVLSVVLVLLLLDRQAIESRLTALEDDRRTIRDQLTVVMTNQQRVMAQIETTDQKVDELIALVYKSARWR